MLARPCPRCGASLRFRNRFPVMTAKSGSARLPRGDRRGHFAVWLCEREHCGYSIVASPAPALAALDRVEPVPGSIGAWRADPPEWSLIVETRANALLEGPSADLSQARARLEPYLRTPHYIVSARRWFLPVTAPGTLFLENLTESTLDQQNILHDWFEGAGRQVQAITMTDGSLFGAVESGTFLGALYYRLNTIHLELGSS